MTDGERPRREATKAARAAAEAGAAGPPPARTFRWLSFGSLWESRNDVVAGLFGDPTDALRRRWVDWARGHGVETGATITLGDGEASRFVLMGDTGEGDESQRAAARAALALQERSDFLVIASDVIYPSGDVDQYEGKFYEPYEQWHKPIYAVPGNHDWYDELEGFMFHLCGLDPPPADFGRPVSRPPFWRRPKPAEDRLKQVRDRWLELRGGPRQPGPYFVIDAGPIAIVGIDTGIAGDVDREQGEWLARVSEEIDKPKVLVSGKPIYVNGRYRPTPITEFDRTVDAIVREPRHGYVAMVGGDIHNYQRYPVEVGDRTIEYLVSGGGGAFMHATHRIGKVRMKRVSEQDFRCFPLRGDSLAFYTRTLVPGLRRLVRLATVLPLAVLAVAVAAAVGLGALFDSAPAGIVIAFLLFWLPLAGSIFLLVQVERTGARRVTRLRETTLTPEEASEWMAQELGLEPTSGRRIELSADKRALAAFIRPRLRSGRGFLHQYFGEIFDVDEPPLYKHVLHFDATPERLVITCHGADGIAEGEPPEEDRVEIELGPARDAMSAARGAAA